MGACVAAGAAASQAAEVNPPHPAHDVKSHSSPHARLRSAGLSSARWTEGFWADRFALCETTVIPKMKEALLNPKNAAQLANFRVAAGLETGGHVGTNWGDGDCYKWIEAMARVYAVTRDPALDREMDQWIDLIARSQADDGYICTQTQLNPNKKRWGQRSYHELYNMGHLMTAASIHYQATGKQSFLNVATTLADYLYGVFQPRPKALAHFGWNPSNIMGLVDLYRVTGQERYLELAGIFVDMRGSVKWPTGAWGEVQSFDPHPGDQNQNRVPLRKESQAVGHAVTAAYLYCGAADVVAETGEKALMAALERIWRDVVERKMYVTGAIGAYHHGVSIRRDKVHEAFGREYELPNRNAYNETCANIGNAMWNWRMLALTGDARYGDVVERVLYNSGLSPMSLDGTRFFYCNPLARRYDGPLLNHDTPERWVTHTCYCCPPSVARTLAKVHTWAYGVSEDAVWVNLYGGSVFEAEVGGAALRLRQETQYPWQGNVRIKIERAPERAIAIRLRIPGWADRAALKVCGAPYQGKLAPNSYVELRRRWKPGDAIELQLPMDVVMLEAHPRVEEARNHAAVMRGPLVYCLESIDLPEGVSIDDVRMARTPAWKVRHVPDLLGGVTALETTAYAMPRSDRASSLYRPIPSGEPREIPIRLIPYYAWNNRGKAEMTVWLPLY